MQIKRFEAKNIAEAFKSIKQEFGPDAVILSARSLTNANADFGQSASGKVEVMAATDNFLHNLSNNASKQHLFSNYVRAQESGGDKGTDKKGGLFNAISEKFDPKIKFSFLKNRPTKSIPTRDDEINEIKEKLLRHGIDSDILEEILEKLKDAILLRRQRKFEDIRDAFTEVLQEIGIDIAKDEFSYNKKKIIAFIGLTGVGKTTTLVKLIASQMLKRDSQMGVISLDSQRVASNALLQVYAKIMGFQLECVTNPNEIKKALKELKDKQFIFVDTPGINLSCDRSNLYIKELLDKIQPDEIHLLMHANTKNADAGKIIKKFGIFRFNRLLFTKLDETTAFGTIINQLVFSGMSSSFLTFGQNIPEDIQNTDFSILTDLLMSSRDLTDFTEYFSMRRKKAILEKGLATISRN